VWFQNRRAKWRKRENTKKGPGRPAHNAHPQTCSGEPIPPEELEKREHDRAEKKRRKQDERLRRLELRKSGVHIRDSSCDGEDSCGSMNNGDFADDEDDDGHTTRGFVRGFNECGKESRNIFTSKTDNNLQTRCNNGATDFANVDMNLGEKCVVVLNDEGGCNITGLKSHNDTHVGRNMSACDATTIIGLSPTNIVKSSDITQISQFGCDEKATLISPGSCKDGSFSNNNDVQYRGISKRKFPLSDGLDLCCKEVVPLKKPSDSILSTTYVNNNHLSLPFSKNSVLETHNSFINRVLNTAPFDCRSVTVAKTSSAFSIGSILETPKVPRGRRPNCKYPRVQASKSMNCVSFGILPLYPITQPVGFQVERLPSPPPQPMFTSPLTTS